MMMMSASTDTTATVCGENDNASFETTISEHQVLHPSSVEQETNDTVDFLAEAFRHRLGMMADASAKSIFEEKYDSTTNTPATGTNGTIGASATSLNKISRKLIAQTLQDLSPEEREKDMHELHGIVDVIEETPTMVRQCLNEMEVHLLESIANHKKNRRTTAGGAVQVYEMALSMDYNYVHGDELRLKFLRADRFNPSMAAERFLLYFKEKEEIFGTDLLTTDIKMEHLGEHAMGYMNRGGMQLLPERDAAGRAVILSIPHVQKRNTDPEVIRQGVRILVFATSIPDHAARVVCIVFVCVCVCIL
jgi:hypothetical protein